METHKWTGFPSTDKPWLKYYSEEAVRGKLPACSAYELLYRNNKNCLSDTALNYYGRKITYGKLFEEIQKTACAFAAIGVGEGDTVVLCTVNMPETVYALYALNRLGAIANLVDPRTSEDGLRCYFNESAARVVLTVDLACPMIQKAIRGTAVRCIILVSPADSLPVGKQFACRLKRKPAALSQEVLSWRAFTNGGASASVKYADYRPARCFVMAHTGGTTGTPKSVMLSDDNLNSVTYAYDYIGIPFQRGHRYFNDLPPFIIYGLSLAVHTTLCHGLEVILYPVFDSREFPKLFARYKPHHFSALSDHLYYLSTSPATRKMDLSFLVTAAMGGDSLNVELEKSVNRYLADHGCKYEVAKGYGMTELAATAILSFPGANKTGSIGVPLVINTVKIVDPETGKELGYNETGELWISGPSVMLGYYENPQADAETLVTDGQGRCWIKTGDLAHVDEDGLVFHDGRIRRIYLTVSKGQPAKIFPTLVEQTILECEGVDDCMVVGRFMKDSAYYEPVAFVVAHQGNALQDTLAARCRIALPDYMWPAEYRFVDAIPLTPVGKKDYRTLEAEVGKYLREGAGEYH